MKHDWHNDWILENYTKFRNWTECRIAYNKTFDTDICRQTFKTHVHNMGLRLGDYTYSEAQDQFLRKYYPILTGPELETMYNKRFKPLKTYRALRLHAHAMGLKKTDDYILRRNRLAGHVSHTAPIGHVCNGHGGLRIKVADGKYRALSRVMYEKYHNTKLKPNEYVIFLDGDNTNVSEDNLEVATVAELMQLNHSLKISPSARTKELTKAGLAWSRLYIANRDSHA